MKHMILAFIAWNIATFLIMGADKYQAGKRGKRISEKALLTAAFSMGGIGAYAGAVIFRHKTKKTKFRILLPLAVALNLIVIRLIAYQCTLF